MAAFATIGPLGSAGAGVTEEVSRTLGELAGSDGVEELETVAGLTDADTTGALNMAALRPLNNSPKLGLGASV